MFLQVLFNVLHRSFWAVKFNANLRTNNYKKLAKKESSMIYLVLDYVDLKLACAKKIKIILFYCFKIEIPIPADKFQP